MPARRHLKTRMLFSVAAEMFAIFGPLRYGKNVALRFIHALPQLGVFQQNKLQTRHSLRAAPMSAKGLSSFRLIA